MKSKGRNAKNKGFACKVTRVMVEWYFLPAPVLSPLDPLFAFDSR
jgi:hypothetical protein